MKNRKEIIFVLSSLNDSHYRKRVEEFIEHGYSVKVYGFARKWQKLTDITQYTPIILGEIENRNFMSRLALFKRSIQQIAKDCKGKTIFYSSLDVAMFGIYYIKSPYIYEVCDLTELTINNPIIRSLLSTLNKIVVKRSLLTIITSEGFYDYFNKLPKEKFYLIPNKVSPDIPNSEFQSRELNQSKIRIGFVGGIRFESIYHFIKACAEYGKNIEIHLHGIYSTPNVWADKIKNIVSKYDNIFYHGRFKNPDDLPRIYENLDLLLCAYPPTLGVKFAEPNKLYEAIYFRCPIIVSENVFLGDKVNRLNIGYVINAMNEDAVKKFLSTIDINNYREKVTACEAIPQDYCLNKNEDFFKRIDDLC